MIYLKNTLFFWLFILLFGCSSEKNLTIKMAKSVGFNPDKQLDYKVLSAVDGWAGEWGNDYVELFQFKNESIATSMAENMYQQLKLSSEKRKLCASYNLIVVSQTGAGCVELKKLSKPEWHVVIENQ